MTFQQIHLRVNDAATGQPTPVRLRITDADGNYYAPHGRLTEFATGPNQDVGGNVQVGVKKWAYIDGASEILLPPGLLRIEIAKGPEYTPIDETITLLAGKMSLRFTIGRWTDVRKQGWHSGDTRVHFLSPDAALLEAQAEDVAVVNLLARETTVKDSYGKMQKSIPNILSFSGQSFARQANGCGVAVNTQNVHPELGSLGLLHSHRVVHPLTFDATDWTLADWCGQCHRKKGLVVWTDPQHQTAEFVYGEPLADLILGDIDAFELTFFEGSVFDALVDYYKLLDAGLTVPLVGASGKDGNGLALGSMRTMAFVPGEQEFTYSRWIDAVRAGRTYVTNGPLLTFTIDGEKPGATFDLPSGGRILRLHAEASSQIPFERLEWLWNGEIIASQSASGAAPCRATVEHEFHANESGWLAVRCMGETLLPSRPATQRVFAHSSGVAVRCAGQPPWDKRAAVESLLGELESLLQWAGTQQMARLAHIVGRAAAVLATRKSP